jgi:exo-beta-1,3-glucanase (GH17 family)
MSGRICLLRLVSLPQVVTLLVVLADFGLFMGCGANPMPQQPLIRPGDVTSVARGLATEKASKLEESDWASKLRTLRFVCYFPSEANPEKDIEASEESIRDDLQLLKQAGFTGLITYSANGTYGKPLLEIAHSLGFADESVLVGIWDPTSASELRLAKECATSPACLGFICGNEGLSTGSSQKRYSFEQLSQAITELETTGKPCAFTEEIDDYYLEERLLELGSFHAVNAHPYFHSKVTPDAAVRWTVDAYEKFAKLTTKPVFFKEVGLPTAGDNRGDLSEANQDQYYTELAKTKVNHAFFEAFDLDWKNHLPVEPHWGLFYSNRVPKQFVQRLLAGSVGPAALIAQQSPQRVSTESRSSNGRKATLQADGTFSVDRFYVPSGVTGDVGDVQIGAGADGTLQFVYTPLGRKPHEWEYKRI